MHSLGWAFINGESEVGYTIHIINEFLDEGPILFQDKFKIGKTTTFNNIKDNIIESIEFNLLKVVKGYLNHSIIPVPQTNNSGIRYVAKRNIADCYIDFKWSTEFIDRFIRALSPPKGPGAFTVFKNKKLIILEVEKYECSPYFEVPGHILLRDKNKILVKTGDGCIWIKKVEYESNSANASEIITSQGLRLGINLLDEKLKDLGII
jgi:methionyl-tRNA formyltransferase